MTIDLYYTTDDEQTYVIEQSLCQKGFAVNRIFTTDADTPYIVFCGIGPIHYEDFLYWIREQKGDGSISLGEMAITDLGFTQPQS